MTLPVLGKVGKWSDLPSHFSRVNYNHGLNVDNVIHVGVGGRLNAICRANTLGLGSLVHDGFDTDACDEISEAKGESDE